MSEEFAVRNMLILDEDRKKTIKLDNDNFIIKAIFPTDRKVIARNLAIQYNGLPQNSYSTDDRYTFERDATLDQAIVESPEWWSNAENCPDEDVLNRLYDNILKWSQDFQEKLKKNKFNKRGSKAGVSN